MKLPVSRLAFDLAVRRGDAEHENAMALRRALMDLTDRYHALAISMTEPSPVGGGHTTDMTATVQPLKPVDPVTAVIREQAGGDHALAAHLRRYASELKRQQLTPDEIVGALVQWQSTELAE